MAGAREVRLHPTVLFSVIDAYERRNEDAKRVIGTLLGSFEKGNIEVTNCFTVPHNESEDEVAVDIEFAKNMYELHRKVNASEVVVGWYSTGVDISEHSVLIHEYYSRECKSPIHVTVDTTMKGGKMGIKAYFSSTMGVPGKTTGTMFINMPASIVTYEPERVGVDFINHGKFSMKRTVSLVSDLQQVGATCSKIRDMLDIVTRYTDKVLAGHVPADISIGRCLLDLCSSVPKIEPEEFEEMFNSNMKDLLMVVFLSQLTRTQLIVKEKLNLL